MAIGRRRSTITATAGGAEVRAAIGVGVKYGGFSQYSMDPNRQAAMSVPTISRARDLIASVIAATEIRQYAVQLDATGEPQRINLPSESWMERPDPRVTRNWILAMTFDDLFFLGRSFWAITARYANGFPSEFTYLPAADVNTADQAGPVWFGPSNDVTWNGMPVDSNDLVQFISPIQGIIYSGFRAIQTAYRLDSAAQRFATTEIPSGWLRQVGGEPMTADELADLGDAWMTARQENAVGVLNENVEWHESGMDPSKMQLSEARQFQSLEMARVANVPPYLVGAPTGTGMTYQNAEQARSDLIAFGARPYIDCIEQTLSGGNVLPRGRYASLNLDPWLRSGLDKAHEMPADQPTTQETPA